MMKPWERSEKHFWEFMRPAIVGYWTIVPGLCTIIALFVYLADKQSRLSSIFLISCPAVLLIVFVWQAIRFIKATIKDNGTLHNKLAEDYDLNATLTEFRKSITATLFTGVVSDLSLLARQKKTGSSLEFVQLFHEEGGWYVHGRGTTAILESLFKDDPFLLVKISTSGIKSTLAELAFMQVTDVPTEMFLRCIRVPDEKALFMITNSSDQDRAALRRYLRVMPALADVEISPAELEAAARVLTVFSSLEKK